MDLRILERAPTLAPPLSAGQAAQPARSAGRGAVTQKQRAKAEPLTITTFPFSPAHITTL